MILFIVSIIAAIVALVATGLGIAESKQHRPEYGGFVATAVIAALVSAGLFAWSATYKQDEGESNVLRSFTGQIKEVDTEPGLSMKAPWVKAIPFDVRNNQINYEGLTFSDKNGTSGAMDLSLTYSLKPDMVDSIYKEYKTQGKFEAELVAKDVAATLRSVTPSFSNVEMMTKPTDVSAAMLTSLEQRWSEWGVTGVQVALGKPGYPDTITERLENLTAEQTRAEEAKAATVTAEEKAKQKLVEAKAEADANKLIEQSLTNSVLEQRRIDMLKSVGEKGNLIITDGEAQPLLNIDAKK
ncbi:SPFH domain-containing protein [Glutamicibacter arilaitensis]|uniref:SPFH domain-containing protein n=1 Tax=Glutamicibacter arilaitensis TaxID=256701 RepID=UPI003FD42425